MKNTFIRFLILSLALWISACTSTSTVIPIYKDAQGREFVFHAFSFDAIKDSPNVEVLDFRYGTLKNPSIRPSSYFTNQGKCDQVVSTTGRMLRGEELYVKWRIKGSGTVHEDTVDLKSKQPASINEQTIHFIIDGSQLYVYMISFFPVREEAYSVEDAEKIYIGMTTPHQRAFRGQLRNSVVMIYPEDKKLYPINTK